MNNNRLITLALTITVAVIMVIGGIAYLQIGRITTPLYNSMPRTITAVSSASHINSLAQLILYYDEVLTQSARNYAHTHERKWKNRYLTAEPELDQHIKNAIAIGSEEDRRIFQSIDLANQRLVVMEHRSIAEADAKRLAKAIAILESLEYERQKNIYRQGLEQYAASKGSSLKEALTVSRKAMDDALKTSHKATMIGKLWLAFSIAIALVITGMMGLLAYHFVRMENKRKEAEKSLKRLSQQNELILSAAGEGIFGLDIHGNHTFMNPSAAQMLGYTVDELIHINSHRTCHYKKADGSPYSEEECPIYEAYKDGKVHQIADDVFWRKDGTSFPVEYTSTPLIEDGKLSGAVVTFRDITERRQAETTLQDSEAYLKTLMAAIQAGVMVIDVENHTIADINEAAANLIGVKREDIIGKECHKYVCPAEKGKCPITDLNQIVDRSERVLINAKGENIPILKTVVPLTIKGRKYLIESFIDISERKRMEEELRKLSVTDNLTQTYNRTKYREVIKGEIERTKRSGRPLSVAMLDIDHFKKVNDTCGHAVGDYVLKTLSQISKKNIREIDYLIRWGGEEFIVIALDTNLRGAEVLAEKIRKAIENYSFDKVGRVTVSFGVTQFKQDDTEDSFMKRADDALYQAKEKGRNRVEVAV